MTGEVAGNRIWMKRENLDMASSDRQHEVLMPAGNDTTVPREWVEQLREGDHQAFSRIFSAFYLPVRNFLNLLTHSMDDAEEICQELFAKVWQNRKNLDPSKNFRAYLYTIARHETYDFFKRQKLIDAQAYQSWQADADGCADEIIIAKETELLINLAVSRMPKQRRRIFELSRFEGMSNAEIAKQLNIRKNAVEKQLSYAMKDIREVLTAFLILFIAC